MATAVTAKPDAVTDVDEMTIETVQAELAGYRPSTAAGVVAIEEWLARRMRSWRRLD
jgi:hypothetical protein